MSIQSNRIRDAYNLMSVEIRGFTNEVIVVFETQDGKSHTLTFDPNESTGTSIEGYWIWLYKKIDEDIQPYLI